MYLFDDQGVLHEIDIGEIVCIKRELIARKTMFCNGDGWFQEPNTIVQLAEVYNQYGFHQIDKNKLINLSKVDEYENGVLWAKGGKYNVSRRRRTEIEQLLNP